MRTPDLECRIEMTCALNPSEDAGKIMTAINNVFPDCSIKHESHSVTAVSDSLESLETVRESVQSRQAQRAYGRALEGHLAGNTTWFYLNKQAAFVRKVAICQEPDESPLGPIKVIITSPDIREIIGWITLFRN